MPSLPELSESAIAIYAGTSRLAQRMRAERPRDGVTLSMISVLSHLQREGPMSAGRLATLRRLEPQTLTRTLNRLEAEGLVLRRADEHDRRQLRIEITERGRTCLHEDMRPRVQWLTRALASLSPTEQGVLQLAASLMDALARWDLPDEQVERASTDPEIPVPG
jgi:DNA-binding MarR family transcriptional regulator